MKDNTMGRIMMACFCGSSIGALLALQFKIFWGLGVLIGSAIGYVAYAFEEIPAAMKKVWVSMPERKHFLMGINNILESARGYSEIILFMSITLMGLINLICGAGVILGVRNPTELVFGLEGVLIMLLGVVVLQSVGFDSRDEVDVRRGFQCLIIAVMPIVSILTMGIVLVCAIAFMLGLFCIGLYYGVNAILKLLWHTIKLVHSDIRLLCMMDSMIGATVGYFAGNVLVGGIVGAMLGVLNYQVVSVCWLKVAAKKSE